MNEVTCIVVCHTFNGRSQTSIRLPWRCPKYNLPSLSQTEVICSTWSGEWKCWPISPFSSNESTEVCLLFGIKKSGSIIAPRLMRGYGLTTSRNGIREAYIATQYPPSLFLRIPSGIPGRFSAKRSLVPALGPFIQYLWIRLRPVLATRT